ncbi:hypothetical protein [uncultured Modestobacter sp.]|uniref:hypothetical protein n=1 Tax=uncultured Modestobacter sp. TaxID=380048 RepID=UPI002633F184|nr:hypothetical protein [uncultured Modestobacter sp.]
MSSTDPTSPSQPTPSTTTTGQLSSEPTAATGYPEGSSAAGTDTGTTDVTGAPDGTTEGEPGWVTRHTTLLITVMVAVIVAALAIAGLTFYRSSVEDRNADTEAAFAAMVAGQGAAVETVECDGDTCSAVIGGQAYTVLVQEDEDGEQHFGVAAYTGD